MVGPEGPLSTSRFPQVMSADLDASLNRRETPDGTPPFPRVGVQGTIRFILAPSPPGSLPVRLTQPLGSRSAEPTAR